MPHLVQLTGTCWFHSILNGLLASKYGQKLLKKYMHEYFQSLSDNRKNTFLNGRINGFKNSDSKFGVYKFINEFYNGSIWKCHARDDELIRKFGFYRTGHYGHYVHQAKMRMYEWFGFRCHFTNHFDAPKRLYEIIDVDVSDLNWIMRHSVPMTLGPNKLDHCVIRVKNYLYVSGDHVITGIRTENDEYYIIDSNEYFMRRCDWRFPENLQRIYHTVKSLSYDSIVYVNSTIPIHTAVPRPKKTLMYNTKHVIKGLPKHTLFGLTSIIPYSDNIVRKMRSNEPIIKTPNRPIKRTLNKMEKTLTIIQLRKMAKNRGLKGYSRMTKANLQKILLNK